MGDIVQLPLQASEWRDVEFDAWLRDQELLEVYGRSIDAADALATDEIAHLDGLQQWRNEMREELDHSVVHEFPQPVAAFYRRFLKGNRDPVRRFLNARDTWEALIHFLHATVLAEVRAADFCLHESGINPAWVDSQALRERIELVRLSLERGRYDLPVSRRITPTLLGSAEQLVGLRNGFSHRTAPTEHDALRLIDDAEPLLIAALREASWLAEVELIRPQGFKHKQVLRGHDGEPDHCPARWSAAQRTTIAASEDPDRELFLVAEEKLLSMAPLLRANDAPDSHDVQVAYLKQRKRATLVYGMFGPGQDQSCSDPVRIEQLQDLKQRYAAGRRKQG
jgi:hypothetical protein